MQRTTTIVAFFFACIDCFSQLGGSVGLAESGGQFPFVYYTPKQGLVNSRVRNVMQDSKGRMLFLTYGGLSIYDGTRFVNYTQQDGLAYELVNDVFEAAPDSFLVATNFKKLNTLVRGQVGVFNSIDGFYPVVNHFLKANDGNLYIAADEGLFLLRGGKFLHLSLRDGNGMEIGRNLEGILEWKNFLFLIPWAEVKERLIVYDKKEKKLVAISYDRKIQNITQSSQGQLWVSYADGLRLLDTHELVNGHITLLPPPSVYSLISKTRNPIIFFDKENNLWLNAGGQLKVFSLNSPEKVISLGLKTYTLNGIMQDREGTTWISTDGNGVIKIPGVNVQLMNGFGLHHPGYISAIQNAGDTVWLFCPNDHSVVRVIKNEVKNFPLHNDRRTVVALHVSNKSLYVVGDKKMWRIPDKNDIKSYQHPQVVVIDSVSAFGAGLVDPNGTIISHLRFDSTYYLSVINDTRELMRYEIKFMGDQPAVDAVGRLWVIIRHNQLLVFSLHPETPGHYLKLEKEFSEQLPATDMRSITIDKNNRVWVGTRNSGVFCLTLDGLALKSATQFTTKTGLTDNFAFSLCSDDENVIWVGTESGLDKIFSKNDQYIVGNVSRANNLFQAITRIVTPKDSTVWALTNEGSILKVFKRSHTSTYPTLPSILASLKVNGLVQHELQKKFFYWENNLTFYVAAPSFIDEKSIQYRYRLKGSSNDQWSERSNNSIFNFINLPPGNYDFQVLCDFPESIYPTQSFSYSFAIRPPWWQTLWFRIPAGLFVVGLLVFSFRFYYTRKLEKQQAFLEKKQAVERERTRIAADMHDDLGAGLSRIKFLSEMIGIKKQQHQPIEEDISKIRQYSHEMIDKMGEIVWALNEKNDSLSHLISYTRSYAVEYLSQNGIACTVCIPDNPPTLFVSGEFRRNVFLSVKETLHNVVKHAQADKVAFTINVNRELTISIHDNGIGFDKKKIRAYSNGLQNMEKRMRDIDGFADVRNKEGTMVTLTAPL